jgi:hypothetical protein
LYWGYIATYTKIIKRNYSYFTHSIRMMERVSLQDPFNPTVNIGQSMLRGEADESMLHLYKR